MKLSFEETVQKFNHNDLGGLSVIKSQQEDGKIWFIAKEIQNILGFQNLSMAIKQADLDGDEIFVLTKAKHPEFWKDFMRDYRNEDPNLKLGSSEPPLFTKDTARVTFVSESGFYGLVSRSRKPVAKEFNRWVRRTILPAVRRAMETQQVVTGYPQLMSHLNEQIQKDYSTILNRLNAEKGIDEIWKFNLNITKDITKKKPYQWKYIGKRKGLSSKDTSSGLNVLRRLHPEMSCSISLAKSMILNGAKYDEAVRISKSFATPLFNEMIQNNINPKELKA